MQFLAISGSLRAQSTNAALLASAQNLAPAGIKIVLCDDLGGLPIFSPDHDQPRPARVAAFANRVARADGLIIASPEYVRAIPGGLKNAIDWLVSGEELVTKPIALLHASHRGDDMLASLRAVLATVSSRFADDIFERFALLDKSGAEIADTFQDGEAAERLVRFLRRFEGFCGVG